MGSILIGLALLSIRLIAFDFRVGTTTKDHPVFLLIGLLIGAGAVWLCFIPILKRHLTASSTPVLSRAKQSQYALIAILFGLALRAMFFSSTPIYEDDWNRYLWDGAVAAQGVNPYNYSPQTVSQSAGSNNPDLTRLKALSKRNGDFAARINNEHLTTIYPPIAQAVFITAAVIKPFNLDALRLLFLISDAAAMFLMVKALALFGRSPLWAALYALNPIIIFTGFNAAHMDILLVPFILGAVRWVAKRPLLAGGLLACAVAVKLWPLILGPVLFRQYRGRISAYVFYGACFGLASLLLCLPMVLAINETSGVSAYSGTWQRSSFLFPHIESAINLAAENSPRIARLFIAAIVTIAALWAGFLSKANPNGLPRSMLLLTLLLLLLSPTGFPWYVIWFAFLIPFVPSYGAALLCVSVSLYYGRFWMGENGHYALYTGWGTALQFGLPLLMIFYEVFKRPENDKPT